MGKKIKQPIDKIHILICEYTNQKANIPDYLKYEL